MYSNCAHMDLYLMPLRLCTAHVDRYVDQGHEDTLQIKFFVSEKRTFCNSIILFSWRIRRIMEETYKFPLYGDWGT